MVNLSGQRSNFLAEKSKLSLETTTKTKFSNSKSVTERKTRCPDRVIKRFSMGSHKNSELVFLLLEMKSDQSSIEQKYFSQKN